MKVKNSFFAGCLAVSLVFISACSSPKNVSQNVSKNSAEEKLGWKLGSQAYTFRLFSFSEALDKIDSAGLKYVEAFPGQVIVPGGKETMTYELSDEGRKNVKKLLKDKGITLYAYGVVNAKDEAEWVKVFEFAKDMGVKVINTEPAEDQLDYISKLCDQYDIKVAIHNHPNPSHYWNPDIILKAIQGKSERIGAAADVGHWMRSGLDPLECLKKLEGKIFHIHFKDLNEFGNKSAHDVQWGTGKLGLKEVQNELKRQHYKGMISAEYEYNWENNTNDVKVSVENFRSAL